MWLSRAIERTSRYTKNFDVAFQSASPVHEKQAHLYEQGRGPFPQAQHSCKACPIAGVTRVPFARHKPMSVRPVLKYNKRWRDEPLTLVTGAYGARLPTGDHTKVFSSKYEKTAIWTWRQAASYTISKAAWSTHHPHQARCVRNVRADSRPSFWFWVMKKS